MKELKPLLTTGVILAGIAILGSVFLPTKLTSLLSIAFAILAYLIAPGYCILLHIDLKTHERIILGTAISAALLPIILYTQDILGIPLSRTTVIVTIILVCGLAYTLKKTKT